MIWAETSAARLPVRHPSSTITARCVFETEARMASRVERAQHAQIDHFGFDAERGQFSAAASVLPSEPP